MNKEQNNAGGIILAIIALLGLAWKAEGALLDRKIKRNRAKRSEYWTWR